MFATSISSVEAGRFYDGQPDQVSQSAIIEVREFATKQQCRIVSEAMDRLFKAGVAGSQGVPLWDGNVLYLRQFAEERIAYQTLLDFRWRLTRMVSSIAGEKLVCDATCAVKWEGPELTPHYDNKHPDGSPNWTPWRQWSSVLYLTDNFDGGNFYLPHENITYRPQRGSLVIFRADTLHGVTRIEKGVRKTVALWFTNDRERADRT